jgi:type IX secretion system PorP/SprF family membrane protein
MRRFLLYITLLPALSFGQDIHYTQLQNAPLLLNPAYTGMFEGWERFGVIHRSQWMGAGTNFNTTTLSVDMNFFKPKRANSAHMGVGLLLYNDVGGDSKFGTKQMLFSASGIVPITEMQTISAGLQFGIGQRSGDINALLFGNQFNGFELDPSLPSNEVNALVSKIYSDINVGVSYRIANYKIGFSRDDALDFRFGVAYFHANRPDLSFVSGFKQKMYSKLGINASFLKDIEGSKVGFQVMFNQFLQGPHSETMLALMLRYRLSTGAKTTGLKRDAHISGGFYYRYKDAIAPAIFIDWAGFSFGFSYDITLSKLGQINRTGGIEFSLFYSNMDFALFKRRRN